MASISNQEILISGLRKRKFLHSSNSGRNHLEIFLFILGQRGSFVQFLEMDFFYIWFSDFVGFVFDRQTNKLHLLFYMIMKTGLDSEICNPKPKNLKNDLKDWEMITLGLNMKTKGEITFFLLIICQALGICSASMFQLWLIEILSSSMQSNRFTQLKSSSFWGKYLSFILQLISKILKLGPCNSGLSPKQAPRGREPV